MTDKLIEETYRYSISIVKDERVVISKASDTGEWVSYDDYHALVDRLKEKEATIDKLVEVMKKAADVTENASASIFERMDYAQRMRDLINSVTYKGE